MISQIEKKHREALSILEKHLINFNNYVEKEEKLRNAKRTINLFMYGNEFGKKTDTIKIRIPKED